MKLYERDYGYEHLMKNYNYFYDKAVDDADLFNEDDLIRQVNEYLAKLDAEREAKNGL